MAENIISARVAWKLKKAIVGRPAKGTSNTGTASFVRTDENGVGWVRLPGADTDTPINGNLVTDMKPGDIVSYRIDGGRLSVMGNVTSPSVGRSVVRAITEEVQEPLRVEVSKARAENASTLKVATEAQTVANATGQHFWEDESGIHVTEATQADWNDTSSPSYHSGPNILINSLGQLLRNGINNLVSITASAVAFYDGLGNAAANVVAQFGADGAQIGRTGESHVSVTQNSFSLLDKHSDSYFAAEGMLGTKVMSLRAYMLTTPASGGIYTFSSFTWRSATGQGINDLAKYDADDIVSYDLYLGGELVESNPDELVATFSGNFASGGVRFKLSLGDLQPSTDYVVKIMVRVYDEEVTLPTVRVGAEDKSHMLMDYHSMQLVDMEGNTYFHVSDLRNSSGVAEIADTFTGNGTQRYFYLTVPATDTSYQVTVSDSSGGTATKSTDYVVFSSAPSLNATITVTYTTSSDLLKAYTFGQRGSGNVGAYSVAEGNSTVASGKFSHSEGNASVASGTGSHSEGQSTASGNYSHSEGSGSIASGICSHAQNFQTRASGEAQTAIGRYNDNDPNNAFEIGNGTADNARSNAFAVDWSGNTTASGNLTAGNFCDAAMTKDLSNSGIVRACRIGNMLVMSGSLSGCTVSDTFTWTHLAHIDPSVLGITSVGSLGALVDVNGGGPSYYGSTNGGGTARIVDGVLYADMQTNVAFSNKFVKFIITAYVE